MLLVLVVSTLSPETLAQASTPLHRACRASQIRVSAGATASDTTYSLVTATGVRPVFAYEAVPLYFYNRGDVCHLLMSAPAVQAVRDTTTVAHLSNFPMHDLSTPVSAENNRRRLIVYHQRLEVLVVVVRPVGPAFKGCEPATATGILMQGYAGPIGTYYFTPRRLRDVCFDTGLGFRVVNLGVFWPPT